MSWNSYSQGSQFGRGSRYGQQQPYWGAPPPTGSMRERLAAMHQQQAALQREQNRQVQAEVFAQRRQERQRQWEAAEIERQQRRAERYAAHAAHSEYWRQQRLARQGQMSGQPMGGQRPQNFMRTWAETKARVAAQNNSDSDSDSSEDFYDKKGEEELKHQQAREKAATEEEEIRNEEIRERTERERVRAEAEAQRNKELREKKERDRVIKAVCGAWDMYEKGWKTLQDLSQSELSSLAFESIPWPQYPLPINPSDLERKKIETLLLSEHHSSDVTNKQRIHTAVSILFVTTGYDTLNFFLAIRYFDSIRTVSRVV
jgi:hypothetical protein